MTAPKTKKAIGTSFNGYYKQHKVRMMIQKNEKSS